MVISHIGNIPPPARAPLLRPLCPCPVSILQRLSIARVRQRPAPDTRGALHACCPPCTASPWTARCRAPLAAMRRSVSAPVLRRSSGSYGSLDSLASIALTLDGDDDDEALPEELDVQGVEPGAHDAPVERKKGVPWTEAEHRLFLTGLQKLGKGNWRGISRQFVQSRTPTQVASHAQKYFIRQSSTSKRRRASLFDLPSSQALQAAHAEHAAALHGRDIAVRAVTSASGVGAPHTPVPAPGIYVGMRTLFGGGADGASAAALLDAAGELRDAAGGAPLCGSPAEAAEAAAALGRQLLWDQWLSAAGGAPSGAAFHRGPVQLALLHNPRLFRPTPVRPTSATSSDMLRSASMPELAALALCDGRGHMATLYEQPAG